MPMTANDFAGPRADSFKFEKVGDKVQGTVLYVGDWYERTNKFNDREEKVCKIVLRTEAGDEWAIWPVKGSAMADAIATALRSVGRDLEEGGTLGVKYAKDIDTGKPQPMKGFAAQYEAPKEGANVGADDSEEPF